MNRNNLIILLILCTSFVSETVLCMEHEQIEQKSEGWGSWAGRHLSYARSVPSSLWTEWKGLKEKARKFPLQVSIAQYVDLFNNLNQQYNGNIPDDNADYEAYVGGICKKFDEIALWIIPNGLPTDPYQQGYDALKALPEYIQNKIKDNFTYDFLKLLTAKMRQLSMQESIEDLPLSEILRTLFYEDRSTKAVTAI